MLPYGILHTIKYSLLLYKNFIKNKRFIGKGCYYVVPVRLRRSAGKAKPGSVTIKNYIFNGDSYHYHYDDDVVVLTGINIVIYMVLMYINLLTIVIYTMMMAIVKHLLTLYNIYRRQEQILLDST